MGNNGESVTGARWLRVKRQFTTTYISAWITIIKNNREWCYWEKGRRTGIDGNGNDDDGCQWRD